MTDLLDIFEKRVLTNVRLTQHQMTVLAMILAAPEGVAPDEDISKGPNLTSARTMLQKLGMITHDGDNKYSVSETGMKVAKDENLIDDMGELTELGNEKAYANQDKAPSVSAGPGGPSDAPAPDAFAQTSTDVGIPGPSESFKFIGNLLSEGKEQWVVIDKQTKKPVGRPVSSRTAANRKVDRLDNEYGAYRYQAKRTGKGKSDEALATSSTGMMS